MKEQIADSKTIGQTAFAILRRRRPEMSIDELLTNPVDAIEICKGVRSELGKKLSDHEILKSLINARKRGALNE